MSGRYAACRNLSAHPAGLKRAIKGNSPTFNFSRADGFNSEPSLKGIQLAPKYDLSNLDLSTTVTLDPDMLSNDSFDFSGSAFAAGTGCASASAYGFASGSGSSSVSVSAFAYVGPDGSSFASVTGSATGDTGFVTGTASAGDGFDSFSSFDGLDTFDMPSIDFSGFDFGF